MTMQHEHPKDPEEVYETVAEGTRPDDYAALEQDTLVEGTEPAVYVTNADAPRSGRVFVWAFTKWYERETGRSGAVEFSPIADDYGDLYRRVVQEPGTDLTEIDDDFARRVKEEFREQSPLPLFMPEEERSDRL